VNDSDTDRQLRLVMFMLSALRPGCVCMNTACPLAEFSPVPHMANDGGPHPHPYGLIESPTHEWRRKRWWRKRKAD
jgi:hypothetical protein